MRLEESDNTYPTKKILIICPFPIGVAAGQRLKYEQYFSHWQENHYSIAVSSYMDMQLWECVYTRGNFIKKAWGTLKGQLRRIRDIFRIRHFDGLYIFMWVTPVGTSLFERIYRLLAKKIIYDIEDNIFMEKANDLNKLSKILKGAGKTDFLVKQADHIVTSSPYLNDYCLTINKYKKCTYISSSIETQRYKANNRYNNNEKVVIGWTGTFTSKVYLDEIRDVFIELKKHRDFRLLVIGNFDYEFEGIDLEVIQWTKEKEIEDLQKMDIGVYPLPDESWVLGKSGLKALQYMGMSIPAVASKVGTATRFIKHGKNGFLVSSKKEWVSILIKLIDDPELRKSVGLNARKTVENEFSTEAIKNLYLTTLKQTI